MTTWFARIFGRNSDRRRRSLVRIVRALRTRPAALDPLADAERQGEVFEQTWRSSMKRRVLVLVMVLGTWVVGIQARLVQLQVFQHETHVEAARQKQEMLITPEAPRGDINDRHGRMLAYSVDAREVFADPRFVKDPAATLAQVCDALGDCSAAERRDLLTKLAGRGRYVQIRSTRDVTPEQAQRVADLTLPGIALKPGTMRYYPRVDLAAHVLGFVGADSLGQAGVEYTFNDVIRGRPGLAVAQVNAKRQRLETRVDRAPVPGATLELTIDLTLQHIVERELKRGVLEHRASGGTVVVMNPQTGEILALASYPTFNPNTASRATDDQRRNRAIQDVYEPGSTFKIVTASAALEHGVVRPADLIDCSPGYITFPGRRIDDDHRYGWLSFEDVIVKSSNVGAIRVGLRTGVDRLTEYVDRFGFGRTSTQELAGGSRGIWTPAGMTESGLASVAMGYQISVTPLQMAAAASAVANGGVLMQPGLVRAVVRDGQREVIAPKALHRVIRRETAATLTAIMEGVTERGTATRARLDRYQVAGKTGTAKKAVPGGYSDSDYNASFVGFVPSRRPVFTILVVIDTPRANGYYGGVVAAPIFKRIAEAGLQLFGVPPTIDPVPPVILAADRDATPATPRQVPTIIPAAAPLGGPGLMPDVRGLGARDAVRALGAIGLVVRISGSGLVVDQTPAPGLPIVPGGWGTVHLARRPLRAADVGEAR
jgi:cell division protein FtsI (penicillin-binding protein 3)